MNGLHAVNMLLLYLILSMSLKIAVWSDWDKCIEMFLNDLALSNSSDCNHVFVVYDMPLSSCDG